MPAKFQVDSLKTLETVSVQRQQPRKDRFGHLFLIMICFAQGFYSSL